MRHAILVMSYGTPERLEDVEAYYTHIRRGSPPPEPLLEGLIGRYEAVGGPTALNRITREQARALADELDRRGLDTRVYVGFKHVAPFISETVGRMAEDGVEAAVGLVLAPHWSLRSIAEYERYAGQAKPDSMTIDVIRSWHDHPGFVSWLAARLRETMAGVDGEPVVVFTAHSVPARVLEKGDPYPEQLRNTCELVAAEAGVERWTFAYQSEGRTGEPWLGPDVLDVVDDLAEAGEEAIVVQSIGFVADHLEILYDLDIEVRDAAAERGMTYARTPMPNVDPAFVSALADLVEDRLASVSGARGVEAAPGEER